MKNPYRLQTRILIFSLIVYAASLPFKAFTIGDSEPTSGFAALVMGSMVIMGGGLAEWIIWLANPLYFFSIILRKRKSGSTFSGIAVFLACCFALWHHILASESGAQAVISQKGAGYYLWVLSLQIWAIGSRRRPEVPAAAVTR